jgi:hypothetical protein
VLDSLSARAHPRGEAGPWTDIGIAAGLSGARLELSELRVRSAASALDGHGHLALDARDSVAEARLVLGAHPLDLRDLELVAPQLGWDGTAAVDLDVHGPRLDRLGGTIAANLERPRIAGMRYGTSRLDATLAEGRADLTLSARIARTHADLSGWIRPLDPTPTYHLEVRGNGIPAEVPEALQRAIERGGATVALDVEGSGYARPVLRVTGRADGAAGRLALDGNLDGTDGLTWEVRRLTFEDLDVMRILGDTTTCMLDGTLTAGGRAAEGQPREMRANVALGPSRFADWTIERGNLRATATGSEASGALHLDTDSGVLEIQSWAARWDAPGNFRVDGARFHGVDLARISGSSALASALAGRRSAPDASRPRPRSSWSCPAFADRRSTAAPHGWRWPAAAWTSRRSSVHRPAGSTWRPAAGPSTRSPTMMCRGPRSPTWISLPGRALLRSARVFPERSGAQAVPVAGTGARSGPRT